MAYFENICHIKEEKQHETEIHIQAQSRCFKHITLFTARRQGFPRMNTERKCRIKCCALWSGRTSAGVWSS